MKNVPTVSYNTNEVIIKEGEPSNSVFLIISGKVKITKLAGKEPVLLATQNKDTIFGEMTLIDGKRRSATVTAIEPTYCYKCSALSLIKNINKLSPQLQATLYNLASIIRKKNSDLISAHSGGALIMDEQFTANDHKTMTQEEIQSPEIQNAVQKIENGFIKSLFRVLMQTAFQ